MSSRYLNVTVGHNVSAVQAHPRSFLLYRCETWSVTKTLAKRLDAFNTWCLRKILRISYTRYTTNESVRSTTGCLPVSERVKSFRLRFFGHRLNPEEDHHRVISAALRPPSAWRRPAGRPRTTCLRTIGEDLVTEFRGSHFTRLGGRQRREILGIRSSVRQRSARSSPPRRRRSFGTMWPKRPFC